MHTNGRHDDSNKRTLPEFSLTPQNRTIILLPEDSKTEEYPRKKKQLNKQSARNQQRKNTYRN